MTEPVPTMIAVTIDANDAARVATFWAEFVGTEIGEVADGGALYFLKAVGPAPELCIQRVPEPKTVKARVHLDFSAPDLDEITERILALGGTWAGEERVLNEFTWRTFRDPEGIEFDVILA